MSSKTEYWIETIDPKKEWIPIDRAFSHREALKKYEEYVTKYNSEKEFRILKVSWEIITPHRAAI